SLSVTCRCGDDRKTAASTHRRLAFRGALPLRRARCDSSRLLSRLALASAARNGLSYDRRPPFGGFQRQVPASPLSSPSGKDLTSTKITPRGATMSRSTSAGRPLVSTNVKFDHA